jgi:hypothetical protein
MPQAECGIKSKKCGRNVGFVSFLKSGTPDKISIENGFINLFGQIHYLKKL